MLSRETANRFWMRRCRRWRTPCHPRRLRTLQRFSRAPKRGGMRAGDDAIAPSEHAIAAGEEAIAFWEHANASREHAMAASLRSGQARPPVRRAVRITQTSWKWTIFESIRHAPGCRRFRQPWFDVSVEALNGSHPETG